MTIKPYLSNNWYSWALPLAVSWMDTTFGLYVTIHFLTIGLVLEIDWDRRLGLDDPVQ
jgi:hypothetical protein